MRVECKKTFLFLLFYVADLAIFIVHACDIAKVWPVRLIRLTAPYLSFCSIHSHPIQNWPHRNRHLLDCLEGKSITRSDDLGGTWLISFMTCRLVIASLGLIHRNCFRLKSQLNIFRENPRHNPHCPDAFYPSKCA